MVEGKCEDGIAIINDNDVAKYIIKNSATQRVNLYYLSMEDLPLVNLT